MEKLEEIKISEDYETNAVNILQFLKQYEPILHTHLNDVIVNGLLLNIPTEWYDELEEDLEQKIANPQMIKNKELREFLEKVEEYKPKFKEAIVNQKKIKGYLMGDKKTHEIENFISFLIQKIQKHKTKNIIDIGCGKGYISHTLAFEKDIAPIQVVGVDFKENNIKQFNNRLEYLKKKKDENTESKVHSIVSIVNADSFGGIIDNASTLIDNQNDFLLLGLHLCGNLTSDTIREYATNPKVKSIAVVGCCYNNLTENISSCCAENNKHFKTYSKELGLDKNGRCLDETIVVNSKKDEGFPMSKLMKERDFFLGRTVRYASVKNIEKVVYKELNSNTFKRMFFRSVLQCLLDKELPINKHQPSMGKVQNSDLVDFATFTNCTLKDFEPFKAANLSTDFLQSFYEKYKPLSHKFLVFYLLRAFMCALVEPLIVLDRAIYLKEQGLVPKVYSVFSKEVSSRNYLIFSIKD